MLKELNMNEMEQVNGGDIVSTVGGAIVGGLIYDGVKAAVNKLAHTPYERTVTRHGEKYTVKYDGNPGW
ncbi:hypothetical protein U732_583 [Clostridium argentinense CDC 2741]|uniref:Bacteriocin n=1 Tax=Clostridium argentinense CDC 2741 TaxID=1418104 RepID=A0A0C1TV13_9CLOT|nr:hypothetical protein [Clostridium argentinense]ARC84063.1 hypothetical protein RSJ17_05715 [Clostridium argentinense]KIE44574.1 hypothetical protein U732_583 [Clostridium argentinense CDC 2741]NFF39332.1 hypothetical protein [Clostridium argentinense]NFP50464.1 hypothetical protein [Clostridium argentinense]NFP73312.1 hypothetical protein [Clostridium argentinense]